MKKIWGFTFPVFCGWCHKWGWFRPFWPWFSGPGPQPQEGSIPLPVFSGN